MVKGTALVRNDDTVCMCKEFREMEEGICHCQLYIIAPVEAKNNEMFLRQADCCISIQGTYYGKILYYE